MTKQTFFPNPLNTVAIQDKGGQVHNVMAYGAKGDGSTDDTSAIQSAITAAASGGVVFLPPGSYSLTSALTMTNPNVTLRGSGMKATSLLAPVSTSVVAAITVSAVDCTLEDLGIDGRYALQTSQLGITQGVQGGVKFIGSQADRFTIRRCYIHDTAGHGVDGSAVFPSDVVLDSSILSNQGTVQTFTGKVGKGLYFGGGAVRPTVRNCLFTGWSQAIGLWYGARDGTIEGNRLINNYGYEDAATGTVVSATSTTVTLQSGQGASFIANQAGTVLLVGTNAVFVTAISVDTLTVASWPGGTPTAGQTVVQHTSLRSALELYPSNQVGGRHRVVGNLIDGTTHNCIEVAQGEVGTVITGNVFRNSGMNATGGTVTGGGPIGVTGQAGTPGATYDITIAGNTFEEKTSQVESAIQVVSYTHSIKVINNSFDGYLGAAINWNATQATDGPPLVVGNTFNACVGFFSATCSSSMDGGVFSNNIARNVPASSTNCVLLSTVGNGWLIEGNALDAQANARQVINLNSGAQHRVIGNRISGQYQLVNIFPGTVTNCLVMGNHLLALTASSGAGSCSVSASGTHIRNNLFNTPTGTYDVQVGSTPDYMYVEGNISIGAGGGFNGAVGAHTIQVPSSTPTSLVPTTYKLLAANTVGTTQVTVAHGLGYTPTQCIICMTSAGTIWRSAALDGTNVSLTADAASRTCDIYVR